MSNSNTSDEKFTFEDPIEHNIEQNIEQARVLEISNNAKQYLSFIKNGQKPYGQWLKKLQHNDTPPRGRCARYFEKNKLFLEYKRKENVGLILVNMAKQTMIEHNVLFIGNIRDQLNDTSINN